MLLAGPAKGQSYKYAQSKRGRGAGGRGLNVCQLKKTLLNYLQQNNNIIIICCLSISLFARLYNVSYCIIARSY
jgi:hypothetical protein